MAMVMRAGTGGTAVGALAANRIGAFMVPAYLACVVLSERPAVDAFGLHLTPMRAFLLIAMIPALVTLCRQRDLRVHMFDAAILLLAFWLFLGISVNNGVDRAFKYGGALGLEAIGGYLIARAYIRSAAQFRRMVVIYVLLIFIVGLFAIPEAVFGVRTFSFLGTRSADVLAQVTEEAPDYRRLGLYRAGVTFDHPILYGTFCATAMGMVWYTFAKNLARLFAIGVIFGATFLSVSSAPLLACLMVPAMATWEKLTRPILRRAALTIWSMAIVAGVIEVFSNRSLAAVLQPLVSLDPWTSYYRLLIWEYATADIMRHPLFGIGLNEWVRLPWMTLSVDCFWLVIGLIGGLPAVGFLAAFVLGMLTQVHKRRGSESLERWQARFAWTGGVFALCLISFTVHYWGAMNSFFFFILGSGAWMVDVRDTVSVRLSPKRKKPLRGPVQRPR